jgi:uncharacterized protein YdeI (YjbR/CyaY-like superfamily)
MFMTKIPNTTNFLHEMPPDLQKVIDSSGQLQTAWNKLTPLARNEWICWVTIVKQEKTRLEHLERIQIELLEGQKRPCCWPGCPHRRPSAKKYFSEKPKLT